MQMVSCTGVMELGLESQRLADDVGESLIDCPEVHVEDVVPSEPVDVTVPCGFQLEVAGVGSDPAGAGDPGRVIDDFQPRTGCIEVCPEHRRPFPTPRRLI